jgi:hypothetical protein
MALANQLREFGKGVEGKAVDENGYDDLGEASFDEINPGHPAIVWPSAPLVTIYFRL